MEDHEQDGQLNIARFLETFNQGPAVPNLPSVSLPATASLGVSKSAQYNQSFERLEEKIKELEEKFAVSSAQNEAVLEELARTRKAVENQKGKDAFLAGLADSIANLKQSVETLSQRASTPVYNPVPTPVRSFDVPSSDAKGYASMTGTSLSPEQAVVKWATAVREEKQQLLDSLKTEHQTKQLAQAGWQAALDEKDKILSHWQSERAARSAELNALNTDATDKARIIASLRQKASQLKAVNIALNREIKRVHQERTEALRKSAEQAKEILSLRDALTAAEERFKSFDFEGRIISVKRQYEQKVNHLETKLQEVSATCMKQVEEIESLKAENIHLHRLAEEREQLAALYDQKTKELHVLQQSVQQLRDEAENVNAPRLAAFTQRMNRLQEEHELLSDQLVKTQQALQNVTQEKQTLEKSFKQLRKKMEENDSVIASLKDQISVLTQENAVLKKQPARPSQPSHSVRVPVGVAVTPVKKHLEAKAAVKPAPPAPVELQNAVHTAIETSDDLPEIHVAKPMPKEEMYNGEEDFLERTDSFIGRMKWSIFREDK